VARDPLGAPTARIEALEQTVAAARASVEHLRDFRTDLERRLAEARALLDKARSAEQEAREAHRTAQEKIAGAQLPAPVAVPDDLAAELDRVEDLARSAAWPEACERLYRWRLDATRARDEAQAIAAANRAPIATRDELRGRLNAYQAKAHRLRLLEDPELAALHARAHRMLHTAPTDLGAAADVLRLYQAGLSSNAERETVR
jgi:chromosome segregation ATPase